MLFGIVGDNSLVKCEKCSTIQSNQDAKFCSECGAPLKKQQNVTEKKIVEQMKTLHIKETEIKRKEEEEHFDFDPEKEWKCIHCTIVNNLETRICAVCFRTSWQYENKETGGNLRKEKVVILT